MISDEIRMRAYSRALQRLITPQSVVLDIGAGTGILSLLACRYGARKVYAVEPGPAIAIAQQAARDNGFADRIEFRQGLSLDLTLPQKADVIVSDLRSVLPLFEQHIPSIIDARQRLLADDASLIPQRDTIWAAVATAPQLHDGSINVQASARLGLDMSAASQILNNRWKKAVLAPSQLLTRPCHWLTIEYHRVDRADASSKMNFEVLRAGTAHGFVLWFDTVLHGDIGFSNAPGQHELIYGSAFFPWPRPVELSANDSVIVDLRADLVGVDYVWSWQSQIIPRNDAEPEQHFRQSTFLGETTAPLQLRKWSADFQPQLSAEGKIDARILQLMDGSHSNEQIARVIMEEFAPSVASPQDALTRISILIEKYGSEASRTR